MEFLRRKNLFVVLIMTAVLAAGISFVFKDADVELVNQVPAVLNNQTVAVSNEVIYTPPEKLENPPEIIKAIYITGWSAGSKSYLNYLSKLFEETEINAVVVDMKDYSGQVSYRSGPISDIDSLVRFFHDKNIYVIGRISVFQDPAYSKARPEIAVYDKERTKDSKTPVLWKDNNGLSWLDPASKEAWDYTVSLAKDVFYHGFDEVNFDYVRFPSDGKTKNMGFPVWAGKTPKHEIIKEFFSYLRAQLAGEKISVDLFGQTTINKDDMGIGQLLEDAFEFFDYVSPMVYPSHYAGGFFGFDNPAEHPYEVVKYSLDSGLAKEQSFKQALAIKNSEAAGSPASEIKSAVKLAKFRPWLQDFNMGADYTAEMVKQEIKATQDSLGSDFNGFMLWNSYNYYTKEAVLKQP